MPGTSCQRVYRRSWNDYAVSMNQFNNELEASLSSFSQLMKTDFCEGTPVMVYNPVEAERKEAERAEKEQPKSSDMMTQLMNASGDSRKPPVQVPAPEVTQTVEQSAQKPIEAEVEPQRPQNEPLTLAPSQTGTLPLDATPPAAKPAPQASQRSGLTS